MRNKATPEEIRIAQAMLSPARRLNNSKRPYLLVNLWQGKHVPARPKTALCLMETFGSFLQEKEGSGGLILGFAETATAIAAVTANYLHADLLTTTREPLPPAHERLTFSETHSHAPTQWLDVTAFSRYLYHSNVILLDDELSTGKTMLHLIQLLRRHFLKQNQHYSAACLFERLTPALRHPFTQRGISILSFLHSTTSDDELSRRVQDIPIDPPYEAHFLPAQDGEHYFGKIPKLLPRLGVSGTDYFQQWQQYAQGILYQIQSSEARISGTALVLGTEECMLPRLLFALELERYGITAYSQATTRSPIGVSLAPLYPIRSGWKLPSVYDASRTSYVYNLASYDAVLIVSDTPKASKASCDALRGALHAAGNQNLFWIGDGFHDFWHVPATRRHAASQRSYGENFPASSRNP